jgi:hypothetical protein
MNMQRNTNICILLPALILSIATPLHDAEAATVTPIVVPGNPSCPAGTIDFKLESPSAGSYEVVPGKVITLSNLGNGCFDWSSPDLGIDQVIAKGGPNGNVYTYDPPPPESFGDTKLCTPINANNGKPYGISHISFCYDRELDISKTADTSFDREWSWTIDKSAAIDDDDNADIPDGAMIELIVDAMFGVVYTILVHPVFSDSNWAVDGVITIHNPWTIGASVTGVSDVITPDIIANVVCDVPFPYQLSAGSELECSYSAALPDGAARINRATVTTSGSIAGNSVEVPVVFGAEPSDQIDECVDVTDSSTLVGTVPLGTVCGEDGEFQYSVEIPTDVCEELEIYNVASFVTNDTGTTGQDDHTINIAVVGCDEEVVCVYSPGYYKNHPEDPRWGGLQDADLFDTGLEYLEALQSPGGLCNNLALHYVAALLNLGAGATMDPVVQQAFDDAEMILAGFASPAEFESCDVDEDFVSSITSILDGFNNGQGGAPHCGG